MAKPIKTKAGTWRIQVFMGYDADGKRVYFKETLSTYKEASQLIAIKELERKSSSGVCSNITVEAAIKKYIDSVDAVLSPSTIAGYAQLARNAYGPINAIKLPSLSTADVQRCINIYAKTHSPKQFPMLTDCCTVPWGFLESGIFIRLLCPRNISLLSLFQLTSN